MIITEEKIQLSVQACAKVINESDWKPDIVVGVLNACIYFYSDLTKHLTFPFQMQFIQLARSDRVFVRDSVREGYKKKVLIVEGIVDTGNTIRAIHSDLLLTRRCDSVKFVSLLKRHSAKIGKCELIYGMEIGDGWVYGYGMDDVDGYKRNLTEIIIEDANI